MHVIVTRLAAEVSLTLVDDGAGLRFSHWSRRDQPLGWLPSEGDRRRIFADAVEATAYFNQEYRTTLRAVGDGARPWRKSARGDPH